MTLQSPPTTSRRPWVLGVVGFSLVTVVLLLWAKWAPYTARIEDLSGSREWTSPSVLAGAGIEAGSGPSLSAGWAFTQVYALAVWKAVIAGLVVAAAVQTLVPRRWLLSLLRRRRDTSSALVGGLLSTPTMMCSCCTAPVANSLRRSGVPTAGVVAYWLGNPLLNPAVLVFLALVAPWQWAATRLVVGLLVVAGGSVLVARLSGERVTADVDDPALAGHDGGPRRFFPVLARMALVLVPEYLAVVFTVGALAGWLFPLGESARSWGVLAVLVAVALGLLFVIPTAGEVPITQGLAAAGFGPAVVGALLITLPAISLPSAVMVVGVLRRRVVLWTAAAVAAGGLLSAGLLTIIT